MRIAIVSTVYSETPPVGYGGIERVAHILGEGLVKLGHDVTLFALPGSRFSGNLVVVDAYQRAKTPGRKGASVSEEALYERMRDHLRRHPVDVIHDFSFENLFIKRHPEVAPFVVSCCTPPLPNYRPPNLVACSEAHARVFEPAARFVRYGLDLDQWTPCYDKKRHLVHISKVDRIKGQDFAIRAARRARVRLLLVGEVTDPAYYWLMLRPMSLLSPTVSFMGAVNGTHELLRDAGALVQTPRWFEAFPMVSLEAFASGTPVIALARGGLPEQIVNGVNGFLCENITDLADAMGRAGEINPRTCREYADAHFSSKRMVQEYVGCYEDAINGNNW